VLLACIRSCLWTFLGLICCDFRCFNSHATCCHLDLVLQSVAGWLVGEPIHLGVIDSWLNLIVFCPAAVLLAIRVLRGLRFDRLALRRQVEVIDYVGDVGDL